MAAVVIAASVDMAAASDVDIADRADVAAAAIELAIMELCTLEALAVDMLSIGFATAPSADDADAVCDAIDPAAAVGAIEFTDSFST